MTSVSEWPRRRASVQMAGNPNCREEVSPQAAAKSPMSSRFNSGVHGESSETMTSMVPSATAAHSSSRFAASRVGGQHLNSVAPSGISSAAKIK